MVLPPLASAVAMPDEDILTATEFELFHVTVDVKFTVEVSE